MTAQRFVWIVVAILAIAVAFTSGLALASMNARRVAFAGFQTGPGMMRGITPFSNRVMPGSPGNVPNRRGNVPQFAPNLRPGTLPRFAPNPRPGVQPPNGQGVNPRQRLNPKNRFPRQRRGA